MKPLVKFELIAGALAFALIFAAGAVGKLAQMAGVDPKAAERAVYASIFLFFCVFGFCAIGLMVHVFTALQTGIGNGNAPMVRFLARHETGVVLGVWGFLGIGALLAAPFVLWEAGFRPTLRSKGMLEADIGMTMAEVRQRSTVPWRDPTHMGDGTEMLVVDAVFDYRLGTPPVDFPQSRYFWLRTAANGRLNDINIGITPEKLPLKEIDAFNLDCQRRLFAAGWMPGHLVADSEETVRMWGGKRTSQDGRYWLKNDTVISFERQRMDDEQPNEPPGSGEFVVSIHLEPKSEARDVVFEPSAWRPPLP